MNGRTGADKITAIPFAISVTSVISVAPFSFSR